MWTHLLSLRRPGCVLGAVTLPAPQYTPLGCCQPVFWFCRFKQSSALLVHITAGVIHWGLLTDLTKLLSSGSLGFPPGGLVLVSIQLQLGYIFLLFLVPGWWFSWEESCIQTPLCTWPFHPWWLKILSLVLYKYDVSKWWIIFFQSWGVVLTLESEGIYLASREQSGSHIYWKLLCTCVYVWGPVDNFGYHSQKHHLLLRDGVSH